MNSVTVMKTKDLTGIHNLPFPSAVKIHHYVPKVLNVKIPIQYVEGKYLFDLEIDSQLCEGQFSYVYGAIFSHSFEEASPRISEVGRHYLQ